MMIVPAGTLIYHGTPNRNIAFDPNFCKGNVSYFTPNRTAAILFATKRSMHLKSRYAYVIALKTTRDIKLRNQATVGGDSQIMMGANKLTENLLCGTKRGYGGCTGKLPIAIGRIMFGPFVEFLFNDKVLQRYIRPIHTYSFETKNSRECLDDSAYFDNPIKLANKIEYQVVVDWPIDSNISLRPAHDPHCRHLFKSKKITLPTYLASDADSEEESEEELEEKDDEEPADRMFTKAELRKAHIRHLIDNLENKQDFEDIEQFLVEKNLKVYDSSAGEEEDAIYYNDYYDEPVVAGDEDAIYYNDYGEPFVASEESGFDVDEVGNWEMTE